MEDPFVRTRMLLGAEAMERLHAARVAVFGLGGVGGYVCEALARSGVGALDLIDSDTVAVSNLNRQILATRETVGLYKADVMRVRVLSISPETEVRVYHTFVLPENIASFPFDAYRYAADAVDTVSAKIALVLRAKECGVPIISAMGAGNKLDGGRFRVADLYETRVCPLARVMRKELKRRGVTELKVVYSDEPPLCPSETPPDDAPAGRRAVPGSLAFVPAVAGLLMAGEIVREIAGTGESARVV